MSLRNTSPLDAQRISSLLLDRSTSVFVFDELSSTNDEAKRRILSGDTGKQLIIASRQTKGRGRMNRSFYSPADSGLYMSLVPECGLSFENAVFATTAAAVAVVRAVDSLTPLRPRIKWVNDIYLDGKKICGILAEAVASPDTGGLAGIVIGIGVNLTTAEFPAELDGIAASLGDFAPDRNELCAAICNELLSILAALPDRTFLDLYRERSLVLGRDLRYTEGGVTHDAQAVGIDETGGLIIRTVDGSTKTLASGEISLRLK